MATMASPPNSPVAGFIEKLILAVPSVA